MSDINDEALGWAVSNCFVPFTTQQDLDDTVDAMIAKLM